MSHRPVALLLVASLFVSGCTFNERNSRGTATGAAVGAGAGALIGAATGSWWKGALFGAGSGALIGYAVSSEPQRSRPASYEARNDDAQRRDDAERHFRLAMDAKDSATSEWHLNQSISIWPTPHAWNNLGLIQLQNGNKDAARTSFRRAIELDPRYDPALRNLERLGAG